MLEKSNPILWNVQFCLLYLSRILKVMGENIATIAVVWLLIEMGGDALSSSILFVCSSVPRTLFGPFVSPLLSNEKYQQWIFFSDLFRAITLGLVPILYLSNHLYLWLFFLLVTLQASTGAIYSQSVIALLPRIVAKENIQRANAIMQSSSEVIKLVGLAGAGLLIMFMSTTSAIFLTAVLYLVSALIILFVKTSNYYEQNNNLEELSDERKHQNSKNESYLKRLWEGFEIVRQHSLLNSMCLLVIFVNIGMAPWSALSALFVYQELHGDASTLTLLRISTALGALAMGIVLTKVKIKRLGALFVLAGIVEGTSLLVTGLSDWIWMIVFCCFVMGITLTSFDVPEYVIIQTTVPLHQQAQVYSVITMLGNLFVPIAFVSAGIIANWFGISIVVIIGGMVSIISGIIVYKKSSLSKMTLAET